ncbi:MAG: PilN domain-containing protein [Candidatus Kerfeldbacteria bacterium]
MSTLNLLNPNEIKKVNNIKLYFILKHFLVQIISILLIISTVFIFSAVILRSNSTSLDEQIEKELAIRKESNVSSIEESTRDLNTQLLLVDTIQNTYIKWSSFISNFQKLVPEDVVFSSLEFNTNILETESQMTFQISGIANLRADLIALQKNMEESIYFSDITAPISNLIQKENINFTITGKISNEIKK